MEKNNTRKPRASAIQEAKTPNKDVRLNEGQLAILDHIVPGFLEAKDPTQIQSIFEKILPGFYDSQIFTTNFQSKIADMKADHRVVAAFGTIYSSVSSFRKDIIKDVDKIRRFYLVDVILNQMAEDVLAPDSTTGDIVTIKSANAVIQKELDILSNEFDFDDLIADITPDLIAYGEYHLKPTIDTGVKKDKDGNVIKGDKEEPKGIVDISDNVDQTKVVAITKSGKIESYLVEDEKRQLSLKEPADYIKFVLGNHKIRIDLHKEYGMDDYKQNSELMKKVPKYIRMGKSFLYPIIGKIKELELLEAMVPASKLSKLSAGTLVGVNLPAGVEIEKAMAASRKIEGMINRKVGVDSFKQEITLESIISSAGKLKVVPLMGDKGTLQKLDYQSDEPDNLLAAVEDIRKAILGSIGVPYEIIYGGADSKGAILKKYARYLRKLKTVQKCLADGLREIVYIHLANKNIEYKETEIIIEFRNKLIEIDNLDRLEFMDTTIGFLKNLQSWVFELAGEGSPIKDSIDLEQFKQLLGEQLKTVGLSSIIKGLKSNDPADTPTDPFSKDMNDPYTGAEKPVPKLPMKPVNQFLIDSNPNPSKEQ